MVSQNPKNGSLADFLANNGQGDEAKGLTGPQIAAAYKAALSDFVQRRTSRPAIAEVSKLLAGALAARRQELAEQQDLSAQRLTNYF